MFVAISALVHAAALGALVIAQSVHWLPEVKVTWLDLDNRLGAPTHAAKQPPAPEAKKPAPRTAAKPKPKPKPKPRPRTPEQDPNLMHAGGSPDAGVPPSDAGAAPGRFSADRVALTELAPGDAALVLLLRMDRIRRSPYENAVRRLLEVFYDHKTLFWSSGLDPIADLDGLLVATPNPYRVTETFLAARYHFPSSRMKTSLERATRFKEKRVRWTRQGGRLRGEIPSPPRLPNDPRVLLLQPDLVLLTDARHLPLLTAPSPRAGADAGTGGPSWIARLGMLAGSGGSGIGGPGLLLQAINLPRLVVLPSGIPPPTNLQVTVEATEPSRIEAVLSFATEAQARTFQTAIPPRIEQARLLRLVRLFNLGSVLDGLRLRRTASTITATAPIQGDQVRLILELLRMAIPQVKVPGMPDRTPPDAGTSRAPDVGSAPDLAPASRPAPRDPPPRASSAGEKRDARVTVKADTRTSR